MRLLFGPWMWLGAGPGGGRPREGPQAAGGTGDAGRRKAGSFPRWQARCRVEEQMCWGWEGPCLSG